MYPRVAHCGHSYLSTARQGARWQLCEECLLDAEDTPDVLRKKERLWGPTTGILRCRCGTLVMDARTDQKFCSKFCAEVARGSRLAAAIPERVCAVEECNVVFQPYRDGQRCCSERHGKLLYNRESRADGRQVHPGWTDNRRDYWHRRRAVQAGASTGRPVLREEIAARDNYICGLCYEAVEMDLAWPDPMSPSLDHIQPLQPSDGSEPGLHDPDNVQLAHLSCNARKNNRPL